LIDASKVADPVTGKRGYQYASGTVVIVMCLFVVVFCMIASAARGEFWSIWNVKALKIFSFNGIVYAVGDWLELLSMGSLKGAAYQVLLQGKFIFTAVMMMYIKGTKQTRLQWLLLTSLMLSMSVYMCISADDGDSGAAIPWLGMFFALLKVLISCLGGVISDKYMKEFSKTPVHIQLVQMGMARFWCTFFLSFIGTDIWGNGFFHGWTPIVAMVSVSYIVKSVSTLYLVALLDALLKNIGEALAVLVIYAWDVFLLFGIQGTDKPFAIPALLAVIVVVLIVVSYLDAKKVVEKATKFDKLNADKNKPAAGV
jgi:hypothetical protein